MLDDTNDSAIYTYAGEKPLSRYGLAFANIRFGQQKHADPYAGVPPGAAVNTLISRLKSRTLKAKLANKQRRPSSHAIFRRSHVPENQDPAVMIPQIVDLVDSEEQEVEEEEQEEKVYPSLGVPTGATVNAIVSRLVPRSVEASNPRQHPPPLFRRSQVRKGQERVAAAALAHSTKGAKVNAIASKLVPRVNVDSNRRFMGRPALFRRSQVRKGQEKAYVYPFTGVPPGAVVRTLIPRRRSGPNFVSG